MTRTVTKLSQLIIIFFPEKLLPHAFKATINQYVNVHSI
jgi:hypothetical protein